MTAAPFVRRAANEALEGRAAKRTTLSLGGAAALIATLLVGVGSAFARTVRSETKPNQYNVVTRVAIAQDAQWVRRSPTMNSSEVKRLAFYTPDKEALQTYRIITSRRVKVVLSRRRVHHRWRIRVRWTLWDEIDVPGRPNGQTGWVESSWLGPVSTSHTLIVVKTSAEELFVYRNGKVIFTAPVGVGNTTDEYGTATETPTGHFWIAEAFPSSEPFYGPWAFGTTDYATDTEFPDDSIVGIHGTDEPWLIPGDPSHGCIRLKDPDILKLKQLLGGDGIGTAVWIE
jgi:lipoprotein-anchoring transpeptidase ErfK/SrfK